MSEQRNVSVVTTDDVAGCRTVEVLGYVEGRGPANDTIQPITAMIHQALGMDANAVVAVRWSYLPVGVETIGVGHIGAIGHVYGTAVVVAPEST
jgi:uncharacterized protein YbjQ (UPF0145 family)